ncbi:MotA/TolQ/ExbB proton channel family protein [bacterium]|nr:MotA/TolQ/ExbB proton channel family protein [bacterium]
MNVVLATGLLYAFQQADLQGKVIVVILMAGSALTWTVMFTKWQQLKRARRTGEQFLAQFRRDRDPLHLYINNFEMPGCALHEIYRMGAEEIATQSGTADKRRPGGSAPGCRPLGGGDGGEGNGNLMLAVDTEVAAADRAVINLSPLRNVLGRAVDQELLKIEAQVPILSTAVTGGPFLGLLGSAWGVMSVFAQMGIYGTVRLGAVAPGISAALLATVVGLLVAVPSLVAYNWMVAKIRYQTVTMENFADEIIAAVEHTYPTNN